MRPDETGHIRTFRAVRPDRTGHPPLGGVRVRPSTRSVSDQSKPWRMASSRACCNAAIREGSFSILRVTPFLVA